MIALFKLINCACHVHFYCQYDLSQILVIMMSAFVLMIAFYLVEALRLIYVLLSISPTR
jgi:hypothetical protein